MGAASRWVPADKLIERSESAEDHYWARFAPIAGYACPSCGAEFGEEERLGRHRTRVHGGVTMRLTELPHPKRLAEVFASGRGVVVSYTSAAEREELRQAMYRAARRAEVQVTVITDGGEAGRLHAMPRISGRCLERRAAPRDPIPGVYRPPSDRADRAAVRELQRTVRAAAARLAAEGVRPRKT